MGQAVTPCGGSRGVLFKFPSLWRSFFGKGPVPQHFTAGFCCSARTRRDDRVKNLLFPLCCSRVCIGSCGHLLTRSPLCFCLCSCCTPDMDEGDNSTSLEVRYVLHLFLDLFILL